MSAQADTDGDTWTIEEALARDATGVLEVLEEFGIRLDPFTLIAVKCTPEELAEYSAVRRPADLREALERFARDEKASEFRVPSSE